MGGGVMPAEYDYAYSSHPSQPSLNETWCIRKCCKLAHDRLSQLPDDILVSVVSRLKLKEAARTSVLSRRWRNLWTFTTGTLDFHYADPYDLFFTYFRLRGKNNHKSPRVNRPQFVAWVNNVLSLHQGATLDEFELSCKVYGRIKKQFIDKWVQHALTKKVKRLKLDFQGGTRNVCGLRSYSLTKKSLGKLSSTLDFLQVISLNVVDVTNEVIRYILLECSFLEELHVEQSASLVEKLAVPGPLPRLKCLRIKDCNHLKFLEIHAINIESFAYHGRNIPVTFERVPHLVEASLGGSYASFFLASISHSSSSYICRVESLVLDLNLSVTVLPELPNFENLRNLELTLRGVSVKSIIDFCAFLLKRCPILRRLSLVVSPQRGFSDPFLDWTRIERGGSTCLHNNVRVLELKKLQLFKEHVEIACSLVSGLPSLDQVFLHPFSVPPCVPQLSHETRDFVARLSDHLQMILPPTCELTMLS